VYEAILNRRSVRRFSDQPVPREMLEKILDAANWAPSAKNTQPWRFYVVEGAAKTQVCDLLDRSVEFLESQGMKTFSARATNAIMRKAPVLVVVSNPGPMSGGMADVAARALGKANPVEQISTLIPLLMEAESFGAAIQNMLLAVHALGLGSLWIGDILYGGPPVSEFLGIEGDMIGAVSLGYAAGPAPTLPRKTWSELTRFIS